MAERNTPRRYPSTSSTIRASWERPLSTYSATSDVFSDDFALEGSSVADGYRPNVPSNSHAAPVISSTRTTPPRPPRRPLQLRSSIDQAKDTARVGDGHYFQTRSNSFTLRHDGRSSRIPRRAPSVASSIDAYDAQNNRPISSISNFSLPRRHQSPFQGATGPSHPYAMYPQDISSARPPSVATTVHIPERSFGGPSQPTHPYGMYPQNTLIEPDVGPETSPGLHFPVGFPGLGQHYQRRLGPDGEDADDIIGPDGHTEQLPPYTRYPHNTPRKLRTTPSTSPLPPEPESDPISPENDSSQTLINNDVRALALGRDETIEQPSPAHRASPVAPTTADELGQNESSKEKWTRKSKKRLFGRLPYWAAILIIILLIVLAATLGGVIGGAVSNNKHTKHSGGHFTPNPAMASATIYATLTTTLIDAIPLSATPTNLPPLPKGNFGVPLGGAKIAQSSCLTTPDQQIAWSCTSRAYLDLNVVYADYATTQLTLTSGISQGTPWRYGAQPPSLKMQTGIYLMGDVDDADRGPAYFFSQLYDKLVILPEKALLNSSSSRRWLDDETELEKRAQPESERRDDGYLGPGPGDRPWFCFWNNTMLEGFIYVTENTTFANRSATATSDPFSSVVMPTLGGSSASSSSCSSTFLTSIAYSGPSLASTAFSTGTVATSAASTPSLVTSPFSLQPSMTVGPDPLLSAYPSSQTADDDKLRKPQSVSSYPPTPYPKVIKIEERRTSHNGIQPYCQQMVISEDMGLTPASDDTIIVQLTEEEPAIEHKIVTEVGPTGLIGGDGHKDGKDKDDRTKGHWKNGERKKGDGHKPKGDEGDEQPKAEVDVDHDGRMGNVDKREALMERLIRKSVTKREHGTRDTDMDDDDGCRCEWIAT